MYSFRKLQGVSRVVSLHGLQTGCIADTADYGKAQAKQKDYIFIDMPDYGAGAKE